MIINDLYDKGLISPPKWLISNTHYLVYMGSTAYGVSDDTSDLDVYGFCMPPKELIFPHLAGNIDGFGTQTKRFEQYQQAHIIDSQSKKEYDFQIYSIIKFFQLCMENNPNMVDALFVPQRCILHSTNVGNLVRENRKIFFHKGCWHKFKGYAYSQLNKMTSQNREGKRKELVEKYGYDVKFAYHVVRLMLEVEQILSIQDLNLECNSEQLKAIRHGKWSIAQINDFFNEKEKSLEYLYHSSTLPYKPDEQLIKSLLLKCIEMIYPKNNAIVILNKAEEKLKRIQTIIEE